MTDSETPPVLSRLTKVERRAIEALIRTGSATQAAKSIGGAQRTVFQHLESARRKAGVANNLQLAVAYDRATDGTVELDRPAAKKREQPKATPLFAGRIGEYLFPPASCAAGRT